MGGGGTRSGGLVGGDPRGAAGPKARGVEKAELGGTCLNWGCIPTKAWIVSAHLYEQIQRAKEFGIEVGAPKVNWGWLLERKKKVVSQLTSGVKTLLQGRQVDILKGAAKLTAANRLRITEPGGA